MSTIINALVEHGVMLAAGTTLLLFTGIITMTFVRAPARVVRLGEAVLGSTLLFVAMAICPLPRWSWDSASNEPVAADSTALLSTSVSPASEPIETSAAIAHQDNAPVASQVDPIDTAPSQSRLESENVSRPRVEPIPHVVEHRRDAQLSAPDQHAATEAAPIIPAAKPQPTGLSPVSVPPAPIAASSDELPASVRWSSWLAVAYLACAGLCVAWLGLGFFFLKRTLRRATRPADWLATLYGDLPWESSRPRPALLVSADLPRPVCYGLCRTVIVMPAADCREESREQLRHVLLHELAHVEHRDGGRRLLACVSLPVLNFHPLYWLLRRHIEFATEVLADQRAARHSSQATYAEQLVAWASTRHTDRRTLWGGASVLRSPTEFYRRMTLLLHNRKPIAIEASRRWKIASRALCVAAAAVLATAIGVPPQSIADTPNESASRIKSATTPTGQDLTLDEIGLDDTRPAIERYRDAVKVVTAYVERLKQAGDTEQMEKAAATLAKVQRDFDSPPDAIPVEASPEVHVVSILRSRANPHDRAHVDVEITNTACPTIVVLVGYQPTKWNFKIKPDAELLKVVKGQNTDRTYGYQGLPPNTPILTAASPEGSSLEPFDDRFRPLSRRDSAAAIYNATGLAVSTVLRYGDDGDARMVVGPENEDWRAQRAASALSTLRGEAEQAERNEYRSKLKNLRIDSLFKVYRGGYSHDPQYSVSFGTVTIDGPEWETFRPVSSKLRCLTLSADGTLYGIYGSVAAKVDPKLPKPIPLLHDGEAVQVGDVRAMTVHHGTGELIAWGNSLYKCNLSSGAWTVHPKPADSPTAAAYSPARDAILGVEADHTANGLGSRAIVRVSQYNKDGERIKTVELKRPILVDPNSEGGVELAPAGEYLAVVRREFARYRPSDGSYPFPSRLFILDPDDGRILWTAAQSFAPEPKPGAAVTLEKPDVSHALEAVDLPGPAALASLQIEGQHLGFISQMLFDPRSVTKRLEDRYSEIEKAIASLPESSPTRAEAKREYGVLQKLAVGDYVDLARDDKTAELHVVSVESGKAAPLKSTIQADVAVTYTKRPVELALLAGNPLQWNLKIDEGVTIKRIIIGGNKEGSKVIGLDKLAIKPKIEFHEGERGIRNFDPQYRYFNVDSQIAKMLREITGLEIATSIASGEYGGVPIQVGPANAAWREQHVFYLSAPLYNRLIRTTLAKRWAELSSLRFMSLVDPELAGDGDFSHDTDDPDKKSSLGKHTPVGPLTASVVPLNQLLRNVAVDPWSGTVYGTARNGVYTINRVTGECVPIASAYGDDPVENPNAVVFDSRRKRLMVWGTELYIYDPETQKWSTQRHSGQALIAAAYAHDEDIIYAVERRTDPGESTLIQSISRINSHGALIDRISTNRRTWLGIQWPRAQIALAGDKLILTVPSSKYLSGDKSATKSKFCFYTLDRKTGEVLWSSESVAVQTIEK